ncbi:hypothetical protein [Novosphingobium album (ex Liu et al. 2023)]|uniref:DUF429 domain-containing protein n=1 Tax=Novosphingobium album (ex Liu et al. 2023) TaxID=3031130 RepID=A0ABT5WPJ8_9SPHN|nr:hypothetical protein [Novosphingobium album (ex Liu et al. 2023)]MDE8650863.1 hypothetical protein [Novosphingobium album (ex Liu et al. 2023)]
MSRFRHFMAIDWSGAARARHKGIAIALCGRNGAAPVLLPAPDHCHWSREGVLALLRGGLPADTLVGLDLGISLPFADAGAFFPGWDESPADARALWAMIDAVCRDDPHLAATSFVDHPIASAYFRRHGGREGPRFHLAPAEHKRGRFRLTEAAQAARGCKPYSNFNLVGAAQVGKSSLTGMRLLHRLGGHVPVWPIDGLAPPAGGSLIVEIYTTIAAVAAGRLAGRAKMHDARELDTALGALGSPPSGLMGALDDHTTDAILTAAWLRRHADDATLWQPAGLTTDIARTEGWTFGAA